MKESNTISKSCYLCDSGSSSLVFRFDEPDQFERILGISEKGFYREWRECKHCGLFFTRRSYDGICAIYEKNYRDTSMQAGESLRNKALRILDMPPEQSDIAMTAARLKTKVNFFGTMFLGWGNEKKKVLDIGAGLHLFLAKFLDSSWAGTSVEADSEACKFAEKDLGIKSICGYYNSKLVQDKYDLVTIIQVLEHQDDPLSLLKDSMHNLKNNGLLYIETPDVLTASVYDKSRSTFMSPHYMLFTPNTLCKLAQKAGLIVLETERVMKPTGSFSVNMTCCRDIIAGYLKKSLSV